MKSLTVLWLVTAMFTWSAQGQTLFPVKEPPRLTDDWNREQLQTALVRQLELCQQSSTPDKRWYFGKKKVPQKIWCTRTVSRFITLLKQNEKLDDFWRAVSSNFNWYVSKGKKERGKYRGNVGFTGYYLPQMYGSRTPSEEFHYPIYRRPADLISYVKKGQRYWRKKNADGSLSLYPTRLDIDWLGALDKRNLEIVYVNDPIEAYFLHVQGSGSVVIENELKSPQRIMVNYAGKNGRPYRSLRGILEKEGVPEEYLSLQGLRKYFSERPDEIRRVFPKNPSYIFFQEASDGPYGTSGAILTPGYSIASDPKYFPQGAVGLIKTQRPVVEDGEIIRWKTFVRIVVNQDTGGAITSPGRVDVYWGEGHYAEMAAGSLNHSGQLYFAIAR